MNYPDRHHPCFFLEDALVKLGADAKVVRDNTTLGCWGLTINGKTGWPQVEIGVGARADACPIASLRPRRYQRKRDATGSGS